MTILVKITLTGEFYNLAIRSVMILKTASSTTVYNFTRSIEQVDLSGQGQPKRLNDEIFKNRIKNGFYIEAGAFDGELRSNSLIYELISGWDGLLVEPNPSAFEELKLKVIQFLSIYHNKFLVGYGASIMPKIMFVPVHQSWGFPYHGKAVTSP